MAHTSLDSVPKDDILEIFTRLDPQSLLNCKRVSKSWYNLISSRSFTALYSQKRPLITGFFYQTSSMYPEKLRYVCVHPNQENITDPPACLGFLDSPAILQNSCNGLLLWIVDNSKLIVSSPLTGKFVDLEWNFDDVGVFACGIAFDPLVSDHFKVVALVLEESAAYLESRVFSSETVNWGDGIETRVPSNKLPPYCNSKGVFLNGVLYWELRDNSLLAYNVSENVDWIVGLPQGGSDENVFFTEPGCLGESKGSLYYCRLFNMVLGVWEGKGKDSDTWDLKYKINMCDVEKLYPTLRFEGSQALEFLDGCRGIFMSVKNGIVEFRLEENAVKRFYETYRIISGRRDENVGAYVYPSIFFPFVQSLGMFNICIRKERP